MRKFAGAILIAGLAAALPAQSQVHAQSHWKAGVASIVMTPQEPMCMAGYGNRTKPSEGVLQDIRAKALVLEDETGAKTVVITSDLLGFIKEVSDRIAESVRKQYWIPPALLAVNASHKH